MSDFDLLKQASPAWLSDGLGIRGNPLRVQISDSPAIGSLDPARGPLPDYPTHHASIGNEPLQFISSGQVGGGGGGDFVPTQIQDCKGKTLMILADKDGWK